MTTFYNETKIYEHAIFLYYCAILNKDNKRIGQIVSKEKDTGLIALKDASLISERLFKEDLEKIEFLTIESM